MKSALESTGHIAKQMEEIIRDLEVRKFEIIQVEKKRELRFFFKN